jgi:hypothetical protein
MNRKAYRAWNKGKYEQFCYYRDRHYWRSDRRDDATLSRHRWWQSERD